MENPEQPQYQPQPQPQLLPPAPIPEPIQPQYQPPETPQAPQTDPGKTLGIVGFVFAFVGLQLIGLILSIVGFNKSKKAGYKNTLAFVGIILNAIFLVIGVLLTLFFISITLVSYNGVTNRANTSASKTSAADVIKWSEIYYTNNGAYPSTFSQVENVSDITNSEILFEPSTPSTIEFYSCGILGVKVGYYDYETGSKLYLYTNKVDATTNCTYSKS